MRAVVSQRPATRGGWLPPIWVAGLLLAPPVVRAQGVSPGDAREAAEFQAVVGAVGRAGYGSAVVVGRGVGDTASLVALLATRDAKGVLLVVDAPVGAAPVHPAELEHADTPADLGVRGIRVEAFVGRRDVDDVVVDHEPFMLETSRRFATHHLVRRRAGVLEPVCEFPGDATSSASKGIGSVSTTRRVTVTVTAAGSPLTFAVTTVEERVEQSGRAAPVTTAHEETRRVYELGAAGACRDISPRTAAR